MIGLNNLYRLAHQFSSNACLILEITSVIIALKILLSSWYVSNKKYYIDTTTSTTATSTKKK